MDKFNHMLSKVWDEMTYSQTAAVEIRELMSDFILHIILDVITYPCLE